MVGGATCSGEGGSGDGGGIPMARARAGGSPFGLRTSPRFTWEGEIASDRLEDCEATAVGYRGWAGEGDVSTEIHSRDEGWLEGGGEPAASFETASLEEEIRRRRPQELRTAERLGRPGVRADFVIDAVLAGDAGDSRARRIGLADLSNGYELKTLSQASSFSTIDGYLRRASKKLNAIAVVFDNTENGALGDAGAGRVRGGCEAAVWGTGLHTGRRALRAREIEAPPKLRRGVHRGRRWQHMVAAHWCFVQCPRESPAFFGRSMCFTRM